ncbi:MAG: hypothetical protein H7Y22_05385 [Gemmatimonadaceae bacterium]|nr:hypothetical protein [Gloeobacterales cyanobacterium ES-bin-141]
MQSLTSVRDTLSIDGYKHITGTAMLEYLVTARLVQLLEVELPEGRMQEKFVVWGITESLESTEPLEILQATARDGIICYFTAVHFHGLTTQGVSHHHIARLRHYPQPQQGQKDRPESLGERKAFDPLGSKQFTYRGMPYYLTQRERDLVVGVQRRYLDERTIIRITTLEQTLLDALHRPMSCGGPAVVFEAWETALERLDERRLAEYLEAIASSEVDRRVGYMLENLGHRPGGVLGERLARMREELARATNQTPIALLPGTESDSINPYWLVEVP